MEARWGLAATVAMAAWLACGGGSGGGSGGAAPRIANLVLTPPSAVQNQNGGTLDLLGSVDFQDSDGDLSALHLMNSEGQTFSGAITGADGITQGTLALDVQVSTTTLGSFPFELWVSDRHDLASNHLPGTFSVLPDDTGTNWTPCPLPAAYAEAVLEAVAWSGTRFVAVGDGGAILSSEDGTTWSGCPSPTALSLHGVAYAAGCFVAVGDQGTILVSPDGLAWSVASGSGATAAKLQAVAGSGTRWVAVGSLEAMPAPPTEVILGSPDGQAWTPATGLANGYLFGVHWTGSRFAAVGELSGPTALGRVYCSPDGLAWTGTDLTSMYLTAVTSDGTRLVASGPGCPVITSTDGTTWTPAGAGAMVGSQALGWSGRRFLAGGVLGTGNTSLDGLDWWSQVTLPGTSLIRGLTWGNNGWVAVGASGAVYRSP